MGDEARLGMFSLSSSVWDWRWGCCCSWREGGIHTMWGMYILLFGVSATALFPSKQENNSYSVMLGDAVSWVIDNYLPECSFAILVAKDEISRNVEQISYIMMVKEIPYQIASVGPEGIEGDIDWGVSSCNVYVVISENLRSLSRILDKDDEVWDWTGHYLFISLNNRKDLEIVATWYKLQKTLNVIFFTLSPNMRDFSLSTHLLYHERKLQVLVPWRNEAPASLIDIFPDKVRNMLGEELRIFTFNHAPSVFSDVDSKGFLHNVSGIDVEVIKAMGQALNFIPIFEHPGPERWGTILPNGTHTGMIGRISRDEAEIGVGNVFVTEVRATYITFTIPYDYERACFITPAPRELPKSYAILNPFSLNVWIVLTVTVVTLSLFVPLFEMGIVNRIRSDQHEVSSAFLIILAKFCNQSVSLPRRPPFRVLFAFIMLCGFVSTVFYSTNLTAFMLVKAVEPPYTSIEQIVKAGFEVGGFSDFWRAIFEQSANENVQKLGERFFSFFPDITPHLKKVVSRKVVLLENTQHLEYLLKTFYTNREGKSPLRLMLEECINPFGIGALLRRHSPLKEPLDMAILHMREGGLVDKFFDMVLQVDHKSDHEKFELGYDPDADSTQHGIQDLTLQHLQGAFLLLGIGCMIALFVLVTELLFSMFRPRTLKS